MDPLMQCLSRFLGAVLIGLVVFLLLGLTATALAGALGALAAASVGDAMAAALAPLLTAALAFLVAGAITTVAACVLLTARQEQRAAQPASPASRTCMICDAVGLRTAIGSFLAFGAFASVFVLHN
jgi:hypothetical protein